MVHKPLHLLLPDQRPFDKENWFESFVGSFVMPVLESGKIHQYWFSRYVSSGAREVRFRFTLEDYGEIAPVVGDLINTLSLSDMKDEEDYCWTNDLGQERFLQNNQRQRSKEERGQLVLDYLHAVSRLFVDSISHSDEEGYFHQERNSSGYNPFGSIFESLHHLFCNMTDVVTVVVAAKIDGKLALQSPLYFIQIADALRKKGKTVKIIDTVKVNF